MEPPILGLVLDSSVLVAAERSKLTTSEAIKNIRESAGDVSVVICSLTVAELAHGIYRANTPERSLERRKFLDELKTHVPIHAVTEIRRLHQECSGLPSHSRPDRRRTLSGA